MLGMIPRSVPVASMAEIVISQIATDMLVTRACPAAQEPPAKSEFIFA
jgi:hypothetical protein